MKRANNRFRPTPPPLRFAARVKRKPLGRWYSNDCAMTIILTCLTWQYIVQVSDRRLTKNGKLYEDNANKAIDFCGQMAFAYSGLAELEGMRTDLWLANVLSSPSARALPEALTAIRDRASECFRHLPYPYSPQQKIQSFVGVGWASLAEEASSQPISTQQKDFQPILIEITNYRNEQGDLLSHARDEFTIHSSTIKESHSVALFVAGQSLYKSEGDKLKRKLTQAIDKQAGPWSMIRLMAQTIHEVSRRNSAVGKNLMAVSIPKSAIEHNHNIINIHGQKAYVVFSMVPQKDVRTFWYMPDGKNDGVEYGPILVCGGNVLTDYQYMRQGDHEEISTRIMKLEGNGGESVKADG
ncbi:MAG: hypothetical protein FJZ94_06165 [Chloroflexi bacterium]|nr:hypothetical protein [Chloroflexota bacterium]